MISSGKRIPLAEVRQGMFVGDVFNDRDILLYSASTLITTTRQIESLKNQGVTSVFILTDESTGGAADEIVLHERDAESPTAESVLAYARYQEQLHAAGMVCEQVVLAVRDSLESVKMGRILQSRRVARTAEQIVERVTVDPDLFFALMQIKAAGGNLFTHSVNVAIMTSAFADALNYPRDRMLDSVVGGMLHDIGKIRLPETLWMKNGNCTRREFELFRQHPALGVEMIDGSSGGFSDLTRTIVGQHHERWNGGGYPEGARGDVIHEAAIMCALSDAYDLLTTRTPYHDALRPQEALATIFQLVDNEYPRPLVEQFARLLGIYPVGSFVALASGEKGLVIRTNRDTLLAPVIVVLVDSRGTKLGKPFVRDLSRGTAHQGDNSHYKIERSLDPAGYDIFPQQFFSTATDSTVS